MHQSNRILLLTLALWASREATALSQDALPASPRVLGRILVLEGDRCLEGEVEVADDHYCVRQGMSEVWISGKKVLRVCQDWNAAYQFMKQRSNLDDPDERLRIARWCQRHNLLHEALMEAKIAQEQRPLHTETRHFVSVLKGSLAAARTPSPVAARPVAPIDTSPAPDLTPESAAHFATKIQPILLNTCILCHSAGKGGDFQLYRASDGGQRTALQRNLKSVIDQVRFDDPQFSPLLIKAISPHGPNAMAPLPGQKSTPFQALEAWVQWVVANHPHLREQALARMPAVPPREPAAFAATVPAKAGAGVPVAPAPAKVVQTPPPSTTKQPVGKKSEPVGTIVSTTPSDPLAETEPAVPMASPAPMEAEEPDEYSAGDFNRGAHPKR